MLESKTDLHIIDVSKGIQNCCCGNTKLEKLVKMWDFSSKIAKQQMYMTEIPYTLLHKISLYLLKGTEMGRDWRGLAGLLGASSDEVTLFETQKDPSIQFLMDYGRKHKLHVALLLELLNHREMERSDIVKLIEDWIDE